MILKHVALVCSSEDKCNTFYGQLLRLKKIDSKILPRELARQIFELDSELKIINYAGDDIHFEIFIASHKSPDHKRIEHVCIEIEEMEPFLEQCQSVGINIRKIPREDRQLVFITDYDGNLFEIKARS